MAHHPGFDRLVFEFAGPLPGYLVRYDEPAVQRADGSVVRVPGGAGLVATFFGGGNWLIVPPAYGGPSTIDSDTVAVALLAQVDDFEAVNRWLAGVDRRRPFRVFTLDTPNRVVVDVEA